MLLQNEKMVNILFQSCISWLRWNKALDPAAGWIGASQCQFILALKSKKKNKEIKKSKK